jgi:hypothetical protein
MTSLDPQYHHQASKARPTLWLVLSGLPALVTYLRPLKSLFPEKELLPNSPQERSRALQAVQKLTLNVLATVTVVPDSTEAMQARSAHRF